MSPFSKRILAILLTGLSAFNGQGQEVLNHLELFTTEQGLSSNIIFALHQDSRGFLWIATDNGLSRYNGNEFEHFLMNKADSTSVLGTRLRAIYEDRHGDIWVGSDQGLSKFNYRSGHFVRSAAPGVSSICEVNDSMMMLGSHHIFLWNINRNEGNPLGFYVDDTIYFDNNDGVVVLRDQSGDIYMARAFNARNRIWKYDKEKKVFKEYCEVIFEQPVGNNTLSDYFIDSKGRHWFSTLRGLYVYDGKIKKEDVLTPRPIFIGSEIISAKQIFEDRDKNIWICSPSGLFQVRSEGVLQPIRCFSEHEQTPMDKVHAICQDQTGINWIGTFHGLFKYNTSVGRFTHLTVGRNQKTALSHTGVIGIFPEHDGKVQIHYLFPNFYSIYDPLQHRIMHYPYEAHRTLDLFIQLAMQNLNDLDLATLTHLNTAPLEPIIRGFTPGSVRVDQSQNLWYLGGSGLHLLNTNERWEMNAYIHDICQYEDEFWLATENGLVRFHVPSKSIPAGDTIFPWRVENAMPHQTFCLLPEKDGDIWMGTKADGLHFYDRTQNRLESFTENDGLCNNTIFSMVEDNTGCLWLGTANGLSRFDPSTRTFRNFSTADGLVNSEFNRYSAYQLSDGRIMMGGMQGIDIFNPSDFENADPAPLVQITDVEVMDISRYPFGNLSLGHNENYISFEFAVMDFLKPAANKYAYQLKGIDKEWVHADSRNFVSYASLKPGHYKFHVKGANSHGVWSDEAATVELKISKPWWNTWWFSASSLLILFGILYSIYKYRAQRLREIQMVRNDISRDLHDQVGATLTSISYLSEIAKTQTGEDTPNYHTVSKIGEYSREMISDMNDIVWSLKPLNDKFDRITDRMQDYAAPLLATKKMQFHFNADESLKQIILNTEQRKNLYLIFKEAINNAAKYSECRNVSVILERRYHDIHLEIIDDGKGFIPEDRDYGNGLQNMRTRANEIKGSLAIESTPGNGTRIALTMPITRNTYRH